MVNQRSPYLSKMAGPGASKRIADMIRLHKQALTSFSHPSGNWLNIPSNVPDDSECERGSPHALAVDEHETLAPMKKRGRTRGVKHVKKKKDGEVDDIQVPEELQRIVGDHAQHLITEAGVLVRSRAPLQVSKWKEIKNVDKETLWAALKNKFNLEDSVDMRRVVCAQLNKQYRNWRHKLHKEHFLPHHSFQAALKDRHPDVSAEDWAWLCDFFTKETFIAVSVRNKRSRGKQDVSHSTGSKSYARISHEQVNANDGQGIGEIELWRSTHFHDLKKKWSDSHSKNLYEKMLLLREEAALEGNFRTDADICLEVLGFKSGYIRGRGSGPKNKKMPSKNTNQAALEDANRRAEQAEEHNKTILAELEAMKVMQAETDAFLRGMFNQMNAPDFTMTESAPNDME